MSEEVSTRSIVWESIRIGRLVLILLFIVASTVANAVDRPRPVFIHAECDGRISSAVLSSFREEIMISQKYQLIPALDDNGRMDVVLIVYMNCAERNDVAAVATNYGRAHCLSATDCRGTVDGSSIKSTLCGSDTAECGRTLFKAFDGYVNRPNPAQMKLE